MVHYLFNIFLYVICKILLRIFASMFIKDISLKLSFLDVSLSGLGIRMILASQKEFGRVPSSSILWNTLRSIGLSSSLKDLQNSAENPSGPGLLLDGRLLMAYSISLLEIDLFKLCMSSLFSLANSYVSRNLRMSLRFSILLECRFSKQLLIMFSISLVSL